MKINDCAIIVTTIFDNGWLEKISTEIVKSNEIDKSTIFIIPDHKTPKSIFIKVKKLLKSGINIICPTIDDQKIFEKKHKIEKFVNYNSDHRRNIGFLLAIINNYNFIISMDDDNFPITKNFINHHRKRLNLQKKKRVISSKNKLFNNCVLFDNKTFIHPRGFPLHNRNNNYKKNYDFKIKKNVKVGCNAGLWTISPDVDAISWIIKSVETVEKKIPDVILSKNTYCPINTQNTSITNQFLPAYYYIRMGFDIGGGLKFDRLGDIFSGYFLQKVIKTKNNYISFGNPLVSHNRHSHNYIDDANKEWGALRTIDQFVEWLQNIKLTNGSVNNIYLQLAMELQNFAHNTKFKFVPNLTKKFYLEMSKDMQKWIKVLSKI